jgi:hypothetical protein
VTVATVLSCLVELAELAVALTEVEMQRRIQPAHRDRHANLRHARVRDEIRGRECPEIPEQLVANVLLQIGHVVREHAPVERLPGLAADAVPYLLQGLARSATLAAVHQFDTLRDAGHGRVRCGHGYLLKL